MTRINPNASIRRGYDFEDVHVLKFCVDWLKEPELFTEIRIQYAPDAIAAKGFAIDDVMVTKKNGTQLFFQLKHSQNPDNDLWDFDRLLFKGLEKWIASVQKLMGADIKSEPYLLTNGKASPDVIECLTDDKLSLAKIQSTQPALIQKLLANFVEEDLKAFFREFHFVFNSSDADTLEGEIRQTLYYDLNATKAGVDALLLAIKGEGSSKQPNVFTLRSIREMLLWDNPRPLNQAFEVPKDFELFDNRQHEQLIANLKKPSGGIKVIIGKPGCGKSTYLSKLHEMLNKSHHVVTIRHHYHLNPKDASHRERLNSDRVREALRAEFKRQKKAIGDLALKNTEDTPLREFINNTAQHFAQRGKAFVLIIDGLDHVIREGHNLRGLTEFLDEVLYEQAGYWLILGTQEMAVQAFPNEVYRCCPREKWIEIKGLSKHGVEDLVKKNITGLTFPVFADTFPSLARAFYNKTQGNPLHLRYVLQQLKLRNELVNEDAVRSVLPYKAEIKEYYTDLWRQLSALSQTFAYAITALDFKLQEEELFSLAAALTNEPSSISEAFKQIGHLIRIDLHGISVYHNSFSVFMLAQPELAQQKRLLYMRLRDWLKESDNEELKWSELAKIEYYLGNSEPILSINREWVIQSFLECRDEEQIDTQLDIAMEAAYKAGDYQKLVNFNVFSSSFANRELNLPGAIPRIWTEAFVSKQKHKDIKYPDFERLSHYQLKEILIALYEQGRIDRIPDETIDRFNDLLQSNNHEHYEAAESLVEVLAHFDAEPVKRAFTFIRQFRDKRGNQSARLFRRYLVSALARGNNAKVLAVLNAKLLQQEKVSVLTALLHHELFTNSRKWEGQLEKVLHSLEQRNYAHLYCFLRKGDLPENILLAKPETFPSKIKFRSGSQTEEVLDVYLENFFTGLFLCAKGATISVTAWACQSADNGWQILLMSRLLQASILIIDCHNTKRRILVSELLALFEDLPDIDFYEDHDVYELRRGVLPPALREIIRVAAIFNISNGVFTASDKQELNSLVNNRWLYRDDIVTLLDSEAVLLTDESYRLFKEQEVKKLSKAIIPFSDLADRYIDLAVQARRSHHFADADELLYKAADNIIAYGNHKDMFLYRIIKSIEYCGVAGSDKVNSYLRRVAPYVYHIRDLTDGDETGSFIYDWANLLSKYDKNLLLNFYFHALEQRKYSLSESLFADILRCTDFGQPIGSAIGGTAIDRDAYNTLEFLAKEDANASEVLSGIRNVFGIIDYAENRGTSSSQERESQPKVTIPSYADVPPAILRKHLHGLGNDGFRSARYEREQYVEGWAAYWLKESTNEPAVVVNVLRELIEPEFEEASYGMLDLLYPHALKVNRAFAFQCLVWAHANSSGWGPDYISRLEDTRPRWKFLFTDFPERAEEFYDQSVYNTGKRFGSGGGRSLPIPKSIPFYTDLGKLQKAETILEYYLEVLLQLFPGVQLPVPEFIETERPIEDFDVLLKRLEWMSPLVRERAAWHIAELLKIDEAGDVHKKFIAWLRHAKLETFACYGLLILLKSLEEKFSLSYKHLDVTGRKGELISLRCMATDLLLSAIADKLGQRLATSRPLIIAVSYGNRTITKEQFYKKIGRHVPYIYQDFVKQIEQRAGKEIWHIWYSLYTYKCEELSLVVNHEDESFRNEPRDYIKCRSTIFGEALKSTFFRLLDYLNEADIISFEDFAHYTLKNLPVDISLWNIGMSPVPSWWPKLKEADDNLKDEEILATLQLETPLSSFLYSEEGNQVLYLNGAVIPPTGSYYEDRLQGAIHVLPFGYSSTAEGLPSAEELFKAIQENNIFWFSAMTDMRRFGFFQNERRFSGKSRLQTINVSDVAITPLINVSLLAVSQQWQYYRFVYDQNLLAPILQAGSHLEVCAHHIQYSNNGESVCEIRDFALGIRDSSVHNSGIPYGKYISIEKAYLHNILAEKGLKLGFVCRINYKARKHSWSDEVKELEVYQIVAA